MNNFQAWINNVDMPEQRADGTWFDMETGIDYAPTVNYNAPAHSPRKTLSVKAYDARRAAKLFGGKALTGSAKQKEWAEKIRAEKISAMDQDQAEMSCDPKGLGRSAHFWIENRDHSSAEIGNFFMQQKALLKRAASLRAAGKTDEYAATAAEYNTLTTAWGFE